MNNIHEQWTISDNEEWFNEEYFFDTKEEAIEFGKTYEDFRGTGFFVGKISEVRMICDELAINVLEEIEQQHQNNDGEFADDYLHDVKREHIKELDVLLEMTILDWAEKYRYLPNYFRVTDVESVECELYKNRMDNLKRELGF